MRASYDSKCTQHTSSLSNSPDTPPCGLEVSLGDGASSIWRAIGDTRSIVYGESRRTELGQVTVYCTSGIGYATWITVRACMHAKLRIYIVLAEKPAFGGLHCYGAFLHMYTQQRARNLAFVIRKRTINMASISVRVGIRAALFSGATNRFPHTPL